MVFKMIYNTHIPKFLSCDSFRSDGSQLITSYSVEDKDVINLNGLFVVDDEEEKEVAQDEGVDVEVENNPNVPQLPLTPLEELIEEESKIKEMKANIRPMASSVLGAPQENVKIFLNSPKPSLF